MANRFLTYPEHQQVFIAEPNSLQGAFFVPTHPHLPWAQPPPPHSHNIALLPGTPYSYPMGLYPTPEICYHPHKDYIYSTNDNALTQYGIVDLSDNIDTISALSFEKDVDYTMLSPQKTNSEYDISQTMVGGLDQILKDLYRQCESDSNSLTYKSVMAILNTNLNDFSSLSSKFMSSDTYFPNKTTSHKILASQNSQDLLNYNGNNSNGSINNDDDNELSSNHSSYESNSASPFSGNKFVTDTPLLTRSHISPENLVIQTLAGSPPPATSKSLTFPSFSPATSASPSEIRSPQFNTHPPSSNTYKQINTAFSSRNVVSNLNTINNNVPVFRMPSSDFPKSKTNDIPNESNRQIINNSLQLSSGLFGPNSGSLFPGIGHDNPPPILSTTKLWSEVLQRGNMSTLPTSNFFLKDPTTSHNASATPLSQAHYPDVKRQHSNSAGDYAKNDTSYSQNQESGFGLICPHGSSNDNSFSDRRVDRIRQRMISNNKKRLEQENKETLDEKLEKAKEQREKIRSEKTGRLKVGREKVQQVRELQAFQEEERNKKRLSMQEKHQRAEQLRVSQIEEKRKKAQMEEEKVNEIAFINQIAAQNRQLELKDLLEKKHQEVSVRKEEMARDRKESYEKRMQANLERRLIKEAEHQAKLDKIEQQRQDRDARQQQQKEMREKARQEEALTKAKAREMKIKARDSILETKTMSFENLKNKMQQQSGHENVREKGSGGSSHATFHTSDNDEHYMPHPIPFEKPKICNICNTKLESELYLLAHCRSSRHHEALEKIENSEENCLKHGDQWFIEDLSDELAKLCSVELQGPQKTDKKRAKKIRARLEASIPLFSSKINLQISQNLIQNKNKQTFAKVISSFSRVLSSSTTDMEKLITLSSNLKFITEVKSILTSSGNLDDKLLFIQSDGVKIFGQYLALLTSNLISNYTKVTRVIWESIQVVIDILSLICANGPPSSAYFFASATFCTCIDLFSLLLHFWVARWGSYMLFCYQMHSKSDSIKDDFEYSGVTETVLCLFNLINLNFQNVTHLNPLVDEELYKICLDLINYSISIAILDQIFVIFNVVCGPIEEGDTYNIVLKSIEFLACISLHLKKTNHAGIPLKTTDDPQTSNFSARLKQFPCMNVTSLLYSIIMQSGFPKFAFIPPKLSTSTEKIALLAFEFINNSFLICHNIMQNNVGSDETRINEFKLLTCYLMWYAREYDCHNLLNQLIISVGYFVLLSQSKQDVVQSGRTPTILQHLCELPFQYFSSPELINVLFPTLIAIIHENEYNRESLKNEINLTLLSTYVRMQKSAKNTQVNWNDLKWRFPSKLFEKVIMYLKNE